MPNTRIEAANLLSKSKADYKHEMKEAELAIRVLDALEELVRVVKAAGGAATLESVTNSTVGEFLLMAASNSIRITAEHKGLQYNA